MTDPTPARTDWLDAYEACHANFLAAEAESARMRGALEELVLYARGNPHVMAIIHRGLGMNVGERTNG